MLRRKKKPKKQKTSTDNTLFHHLIIMSYNGIGLQSVRGSATSGHIQKNIANKISKPGHYESRKNQKSLMSKRADEAKQSQNKREAYKQIKSELTKHEQLRRIEVKCMDLQDELEEQGVEPDEIKARVDELRKKLNNKEFDENGAKSPTTTAPQPSRKDKQSKEDVENENNNKDGVFEYKRRYADKRK